MKKYLIILIVGCALAYWYRLPCYVQPGRAQVAPASIRKAMLKMGPGYDYEMEGDVLRVYIQGQWQKLQY